MGGEGTDWQALREAARHFFTAQYHGKQVQRDFISLCNSEFAR
jgi:hypothetical protein